MSSCALLLFQALSFLWPVGAERGQKSPLSLRGTICGMCPDVLLPVSLLAASTSVAGTGESMKRPPHTF